VIETNVLHYCYECDVASVADTCWVCGEPTSLRYVGIASHVMEASRREPDEPLA